jgi:ubiquinone/menaquinone biosynthesis C-methylase UbiE
MGLYNDALLPRAIDRVCGSTGFDGIRQRLLASAQGTVLEIGFGSGTNLRHYPSAVTGVAAVEPAAKMRELAAQRIRERELPVTFVDLDDNRILTNAGSCDTAVSTFTLCTVEDPAATLAEILRVLRPGGELLIAEHGRAPGRPMAASQRLLEPMQRRLAGGCNLTREPLELLRTAGFEIVTSRQDYLGTRSPWGYLTVATARR